MFDSRLTRSVAFLAYLFSRFLGGEWTGCVFSVTVKSSLGTTADAVDDALAGGGKTSACLAGTGVPSSLVKCVRKLSYLAVQTSGVKSVDSGFRLIDCDSWWSVYSLQISANSKFSSGVKS